MAQPESSWPSGRVVAVHLTALSALAITHPLLQLIGRDPEFLLVHQVDGAGVFVFVALLLLVTPGLAVATAWIFRRLSLRGYRGFVGLCIGAAAAALALQALRGVPLIGAGIASLAAAVFIGLAAGLVYGRSALARSFVTALSPAILIVPVLFLLNSSIRPLLSAAPHEEPAPVVQTKTPIVVIVFDELPLASLLDADRTIDAARYPSFAALAGEGTWFRNTTTVATHTRWAIPALLSGSYPPAAAVPTTSWYPNNVFTLFGGTHDLHVFEPMTRLCPRTLCAGDQVSPVTRTAAIAKDMAIVYLHLVVPDPWTAELPPVDEAWGNFGAAAAMSKRAGWLGLPDFDERRTKPLEFIRSMAPPGEKPGFWFMHILLPHNPYVYLPTGQAYDEPQRADPAMRGGFWVDDPAVVGHVYQRHLLQVQYADHVLGLLVTKLREIGVYEEALVAVLADHGVSFQPGDRRRTITDTNRADILSVPFVIKPPQGDASRIVDDPVEVVDLLPTIASMLNVTLPWKVDGRAPGADGASRSGSRKVLSLPPGNRLMEDPDRYRVQDLPWGLHLVEEAVQRKLALFQNGDPLRPMFSSYATIIGQSIAQAEIGAAPNVNVIIENHRLFENVVSSGDFVPVRVHGTVAAQTAGAEPVTLAIAVNGTIQATAGVAPDGSWSALVPPTALRDGANDVEVFLVARTGAAPLLARPSAVRAAR